MMLKTIAALIGVIIGISVFGGGVDGRMVEFTCSGYEGDSTISDFPVLVRLAANSPAGFSYSDMLSSASAAELRFCDEEGSQLPYEVESWNPSGESLLWVKLPKLAKSTEFFMYYGKTPDTVVPAATDVWSGYVGVWHM